MIDPRSFGPMTIQALNDASIPPQAQMVANLAALQAAVNAAIAQGSGEIVLPLGRINVYGTLLLQQNAGNTPNPNLQGWLANTVRIRGAGQYITKLIQNHPTAPLVRITGLAQWQVESLSLFGRGMLTAGDTLQVFGSPQWRMRDVNVGFTAGKGFYNNNSERGNSDNLQAFGCRMGVVHFGNECYYHDTKIVSPGFVSDDGGGNAACLSVNSSNGTTINQSGSLYQEKRAGLVMGDGQNVAFYGGSIKITQGLAGVKVIGCEVASFKNLYIEGYAMPAPNPSFIIGGAFERFSLSAAMAATDMTATVADASWSVLTFNDTSDIALGGGPACYVIYEPSNPAVYEIIAAYGFIGNALQIAPSGRGASLNGVQTTAQAWSAGAVIREVVGSRLSNTSFSLSAPSPTLEDLHLTSYGALGSCSISEDVTQGNTNGQIILGHTFDEWATSAILPPPTSNVTLILKGYIGWMGSGRQLAIQVHRQGTISNLGTFDVLFGENVVSADTANDACFSDISYTGPDGTAQTSPTESGYAVQFENSPAGGYQVASAADIVLAALVGQLQLTQNGDLFWKGNAAGAGLEFHVAGGGSEMVSVVPLGTTEFPNFETPLMISAKAPPYTPPAGSAFLYVDPADGKLKAMDSTGTVTVLTPV